MNIVEIHANKKARSEIPVNLKIWLVKINGEEYTATGVDIKCAAYTLPRPEEGIRGIWRICCHPETITWNGDYCVLE